MKAKNLKPLYVIMGFDYHDWHNKALSADCRSHRLKSGVGCQEKGGDSIGRSELTSHDFWSVYNHRRKYHERQIGRYRIIVDSMHIAGGMCNNPAHTRLPDLTARVLYGSVLSPYFGEAGLPCDD